MSTHEEFDRFEEVMADELYRLRKRAEIRRQIASVQEDDLLEEAIERLEAGRMLSNKIMRERSEVLVIAHFGRALAERWWKSPNLAFDSKTPSEQWDQDPHSVYNYLMNSGT